MMKTTTTKKKLTSELLVGDCMKFLTARDQEGARPIDLMVADPPYNYGVDYDFYSDDKEGKEYRHWTYTWLTLASRVLAKHGAMFVFFPDELVSFVDTFCQEALYLHKRAHIIWYYTFGMCNVEAKNWSRSHTHILYFTKTKTKWTFNADAIRVPS